MFSATAGANLPVEVPTGQWVGVPVGSPIIVPAGATVWMTAVPPAETVHALEPLPPSLVNPIATVINSYKKREHLIQWHEKRGIGEWIDWDQAMLLFFAWWLFFVLGSEAGLFHTL